MKRLIPVIGLFVTTAWAWATSRTNPPEGSLVVKLNNTEPGEFANLTAAVAALPDDGSSQTIFIYPGRYEEQVIINASGPVTVSWVSASL